MAAMQTTYLLSTGVVPWSDRSTNIFDWLPSDSFALFCSTTNPAVKNFSTSDSPGDQALAKEPEDS